jgi:hypothetical protein
VAVEAAQPNGHTVPTRLKALAASVGVSLNLQDKGDDLDKDFERY